MSRSIKIRLAVMMFMQLFILGATMPVMSLYLRDYLQFSGSQAGLIISMMAFSTFIAPFAGAFIADRFISAERCLSLCHLTAGGVMLLLSYQSTFSGFLSVYIVYVLVYGPTVALVNAVAFHHIPDKNKFGDVRVWGTIGWVAVAWLISLWLSGGGETQADSRLPDVLKLSAIASFTLGFYALTLPRANIITEKPKRLIPIESFRVMRDPKIMLICWMTFLIAFANKYYYFGMAPFLKQFGTSEVAIPSLMSIGQIAEIAAMLLLGVCLKRIGFKAVLIIGILSQMWRFAAFIIAGSLPVIASGIACHGVNYAFFIVAALIFVDSRCQKNSRTGVHQLFIIVNGGFGGFAGNFVAGRAMDFFTVSTDTINFRGYWTIPLMMTIICLIITAIFVPRDGAGADVPAELGEV